MLAFNDIYRKAAEGAGAEFVDIWDGFVDENGAYVSTGPDINGQPVRLRAGDGINLSKAGKRKVAFYAEKPLNKLLGEIAMPGVAAFAPAKLPGQRCRRSMSVPSCGPSRCRSRTPSWTAAASCLAWCRHRSARPARRAKSLPSRASRR